MTRYYTEDHEWVDVDGDIVTIGITEHAAEQLGEVVFVEAKAIGETVAKGDDVGVIESVKAASDIYAPLSGEITEVNDEAVDNPGSFNDDPEGAAWLMKLKIADQSEFEDLMDKAAYDALIAE
ncbi:MAG: glycine cleavage system protein GcvH [Alphaproteobacteria bacterium]